jgi:hypothetical protein
MKAGAGKANVPGLACCTFFNLALQQFAGVISGSALTTTNSLDALKPANCPFKLSTAPIIFSFSIYFR